MSRVAEQSALDAVKSEGGLLPSDILHRIAANDRTLPGMRKEDYHLGKNETVAEAITRSWNRLVGLWSTFREDLARRPENDPAQALTRDRFLLPLFQELGFGRLPRANVELFVVDERHYSISHLYHRSPIHLVGAGLSLDRRSAGVSGAATASPHGLVQDYLNRSDQHLWAFLSNGRTLRILRDHYSLTRQAYVEFDLESIFEGELFHAFRLLWLVCHQSRVEAENPEHCWLERWFETARDEGVRALDHLRDGVKEAIEAFGRGFLAHADNTALRDALASGRLSAQDYYRELLRLAYRLIFLFVAEDREVLLDPNASPEAQRRYLAYYATKRIRDLARRRRGSSHGDLWESLRLVMGKLHEGYDLLALPALGSFLWSADCLPNLANSQLTNKNLLAAIRYLATFQDGNVLYPVNWRNVGSEELGSVYESLLELSPDISKDTGFFALNAKPGHERKTTGSYYTPSALVDYLLDSCLSPVVDRALVSDAPENALLDLKICDPACGSGHFLVAAARRMAHSLARLRLGDDEPSPEAVRQALRDVIGRCVFGVDLNPMAVELCKVSLWMEAVEPGKPLSFLDSHIQQGNSLLGATPDLMRVGIPDTAWKPFGTDSREVASALRARNAAASGGQRGLANLWSDQDDSAKEYRQARAYLESSVDRNSEALAAKESQWKTLLHSASYQHQKLVADSWCAAFVWPKQVGPLAEAAPTNDIWRQIRDSQGEPDSLTVRTVRELANEYGFFHWHLAFPQVFERGGFDVVLGNPPWDTIRFNEKEFFAANRPDIARAPTAARRKVLIEGLSEQDPGLFDSYRRALRLVGGENVFVRAESIYPLCGVGRVNVYALFAERARAICSNVGAVGQVLPSGIVTDDSTKLFFQAIVEDGELVHFFDFENRKPIFPGVHRSYKFGLLALRGTALSKGIADFVFFATEPEHVEDSARRFQLSSQDIELLNPTTKTCPIFRSRRDAELTVEVYRRLPVLSRSSWQLRHQRLINQSDDSKFFASEKGPGLLPLYEGKYFHHYDHRWVTNESDEDRPLTLHERRDPSFHIRPRYWYPAENLESRFASICRRNWVIAWRDITNATNERSLISMVLPSVAVPNTARVFDVPDEKKELMPAFVANLSGFALDYLARQKIGGTHMSGFIVDQLPVIEPGSYEQRCVWAQNVTVACWIRDRATELLYTAWDLEPFARDVGYDGPPFRWDPERRFLLRAELDAAFFHLYGIERDDVDYIMETFPIVRRNDEKVHGEYRTKRVVLEVYDALMEAAGTGRPYQSRLDPLPSAAGASHGAFAFDGVPKDYAEALRMGLLYALICGGGDVGIPQGGLSRALLWLEDAKYAAAGLQGEALATFEQVRESDPLLMQGASDASKLLEVLENEQAITRDTKGMVRLRAGGTMPTWLPRNPTLAKLAGLMQGGLGLGQVGGSTAEGQAGKAKQA